MRFTVIILFLCAIAAFVLFELERGRPEYRGAQNEERRLKLQLADLRSQNERMREQVRRMRDDIFYIEKHAREKFGYAASNEIIVRFDK